MKVLVRTGSIYEPADRIGLAQITGMLMRIGGAGDLSPEQYDLAVDSIGAIMESSIGRESGTATGIVLSEDLEMGVRLLMDLVFRPAFNPGRLNVARMKMAETLRRQKDDPDTYATILFDEFLYGSGSPWARRPKPQELGRIGIDDIREFYGKYFKTSNVIIAASGDFSTGEFLRLIRKYTEGASEGKIKFPEVPEIELEFKPGLRMIAGPRTQSFVRMGHYGVRRHNPDWFSIFVLSRVLGAGDFKSRLMEDIRTKRGLAYSIWGGISQGTDYGEFAVKFSTAAHQTEKAIDLVRHHIVRLAEGKDVTDAEVSFAKRTILSSAIFELDSPFKIVCDRAKFFFYDYPPDYWLVAFDGVSTVTKEDVNRAAEEYLHPDGLKVLILGPR